MESLGWKRAEILAQWTKRHLLNKELKKVREQAVLVCRGRLPVISTKQESMQADLRDI